MEAEVIELTKFLGERQQLTIPIFQRNYSWTIKQCSRLWEDIKKILENPEIEYHFLGSIVRIGDQSSSNEEIPKQVIIDGQQRITTVLLLVCAIVQSNVEEESKRLQEEFLINKDGKGELYHKVLLAKEDRESLICLIDVHPTKEITSPRIKENFEFFQNELKNEDSGEVEKGIRKLKIVDIVLDLRYDNPQLIFESLNSTGLPLTQADLIRNFILMGLEPARQEKLYNHYWHEMEKNFGTHYAKWFDSFMRDYLTMKTGSIPNIKNVYETFKGYFEKKDSSNNIEDLIEDVYKFSKYYVNIALNGEKNVKLKRAFDDLEKLKVNVAYPFLLKVYEDFKDEIITEGEFVEILDLVQSYVFRRFVCDLRSGALNSVFAHLYPHIDKDKYLESLKAKLVLMPMASRFPKNVDFMRSLEVKDLYNIGKDRREFWLGKLENFERKEYVNIKEYTVEHIMPQNKKLSNEWKRELGEDWQGVHETYLHTLGNLTLTGYNSELSDKPFLKKKTMEGGFSESSIRLNKSVTRFTLWDGDSIKKRTNILAKEMVDIWKYPDVSEEVLGWYKELELEEKSELGGWTLKNMDGGKHLEGFHLKRLFDLFKREIMNIDRAITEEVTKVYVAYKINDKSFVDLVPQKNKLKFYLKLDFDEVDDPEGLCRDVSKIGSWGTGNVEVTLGSDIEIEYVMKFVRQSYEKTC